MDHAANTAFEAAKEAFASLAQGLRHIHWEDLPSWICNYIVEQPGLTAAQIICLVILAVPAIVTMPLLGALGFTNLGPAAGKQQDTSLAKQSSRMIPSTFGTTALFSTLQSYMMAGVRRANRWGHRTSRSSGRWSGHLCLGLDIEVPEERNTSLGHTVKRRDATR
ncbi:hypothetical protein D0864_16276 [Hortaea werneckii]|uniref:Uncharacterized protein n=2 Tax=Hortaea werneckii TaxID=91943 RepID=A0A3M7BLB2_HORWE|nr:hypothetical protein D0864_16276 [Hortaea werneckii]